jgi:hypothetical protein
MEKSLINVKDVLYSDDSILTNQLANNIIFKNTIGKLTGYISQYNLKDHLLNHIKCTEKNFSDIFYFSNEFSHQICIKPPQIFIAQSSNINACTYGSPENAFIILNSKLVDTFSANEVKFVIGHELGHIAAGHCQLLTLTNILFNAAFSTLDLLPIKAIGTLTSALKFMAITHRQWEKAAEITADRFGFLAVRDKKTAFGALINLKMGMVNRIDIDVDDYLKQFEEIGDNWIYKINEISNQLSSTHPNIFRRILVLKLFSESVAFGELSGKELDSKIHAVLLGTSHQLLSANEQIEEFLCKAALFIGQADGKIDKNEKKYFNKMISSLNMSKKMKDHLVEMLENNIFLNDISLPFELSDYQLEFVSKAVTDMAISDGVYSYVEDEKLVQLFSHLNLSRKYLDEIRAKLIKKYGDKEFMMSMLK